MIPSTGGSTSFMQRGAISINNSNQASRNNAPRTSTSSKDPHFSRRTTSPIITKRSSSSSSSPQLKNQQATRTSSSSSNSTNKIQKNSAAKPTTTKSTTQKTTSASSSSVLVMKDEEKESDNNTTTIEERTAKQVILPKDPDTKKLRRLFNGCKLYYSSFPRDCIENIARNELGMSRTPYMDKADIIWIEHNPLSHEGLRQIDPEYQRVNTWCGMKNLATKCEFGMVMNLARSVIDPLYPSIYSYLPRTFVLPQDKDALLEYVAANSKTKKNKMAAASAIAGRRGVQKWRQVSRTGTFSANDRSTTHQQNDDDDDDDERESTLDCNSSADSDLHRFYLEQSAKQSDPVFVVKPDEGCGGDGIFLCSDLQNIPIHQNCVVQEYVTNPLLLGGIKFDLRVYVLITSVQPLRFYVHREGLARMAVEKYEYPSKKNFHKLNMHLTNYSLNKWNNNFVNNVNEDHDENCSKRTISTAFAQLEQEYGPEHFDAEEVWENIGLVTETTLFSFAPFLLLGADVENTASPGAQAPMPCFQIIGIDILIDSAMKPHLLEVNHHPSLLTEAPVDAIVKGLLARHVLRMIAHPWAKEHERRLLLKPKKKKGSTTTSSKTTPKTAAVVDKNRPWRAAMEKEKQISSSSDDDEEEEEEEEEIIREEKQNNKVSDHPAATASPSPSTKPPLSSNTKAVLAATENITDPEKKETTACRANYENGEHSGFDGRTVPDTQAEWEELVKGPLFLSWNPDSASRPIYKFVVQPFLKLRDIFVSCCGGALSRNKSVDSMNGTRFARFARKYGVAKSKNMTEIDLMYLRHTRERGSATLRFTDFVWLLLVELGSVLVPASGLGIASHEKLAAVVDFLESNSNSSNNTAVVGDENKKS